MLFCYLLYAVPHKQQKNERLGYPVSYRACCLAAQHHFPQLGYQAYVIKTCSQHPSSPLHRFYDGACPSDDSGGFYFPSENSGLVREHHVSRGKQDLASSSNTCAILKEAHFL